jgi:hypothetical protein
MILYYYCKNLLYSDPYSSNRQTDRETFSKHTQKVMNKKEGDGGMK